MILLGVVIILGWWLGAGLGLIWLLLRLFGWVLNELINLIPQDQCSKPDKPIQKKTPKNEGFIL